MKPINKGLFLFIIIMLTLAFPLFQGLVPVVKVSALKGYIAPVQKSDFSVKAFWDESYQKNTEKYLKRNVGFHPTLVRIKNQIDYNLFGKINAVSIIEGKDGHLYGRDYIKAYYGDDFLGYDSIISKAEKIRFVQDTLDKLNIQLFVVIASAKSFIHPEYIPDSYTKQIGMTNYKAYVNSFDSLGVNYIDFVPVIKSMDDTSLYSVHPKAAIHWSYYAALSVSDSIKRYIENVKKVKLPEFSVESIETTSRPRNSDKDIEDGLNLLFTFNAETYAYPKIVIDSSEFKPSLNALIIADSYYYILLNNGFSHLFNEDNFWFYNKDVYPNKTGAPLMADSLNLRTEVGKRDVIIILANPAKLKTMAWGFIDNTYELFQNKE